MYKMVDISAEVWNKAEVSVIRIHQKDHINKTLLYYFVFLKQIKDGVVKIFMT